MEGTLLTWPAPGVWGAPAEVIVQPGERGEGKHPCTGENGNLSRRCMEWGSIGWERETLQREGPRGAWFLLTCMVKALDSSMSNISFHSKIRSFSDAKAEIWSWKQPTTKPFPIAQAWNPKTKWKCRPGGLVVDPFICIALMCQSVCKDQTALRGNNATKEPGQNWLSARTYLKSSDTVLESSYILEPEFLVMYFLFLSRCNSLLQQNVTSSHLI